MPLFTTDFAPPPAPSDLSIEADLPASAVRLQWAPTSVAPEDFGGYRVYRRVAEQAWALLAEYSGTAAVTHDDFTAPLNSGLGYRVTQSNLDFESDPAEGAASLDSNAWWVVAPDDESLTFAVTKVRSARLTSPVVQETYSPIGRRGKLVVGDVVQAEDGELSFLVMPDNPGMVALLHRVQARMDGELLLKAPDGVVHEVRIGSITRSFTQVEGLQELTLPFTGTA